jgi:hypothetical protein
MTAVLDEPPTTEASAHVDAAQRRFHLLVLGLSITVIVLSFVLTTVADKAVSLPGLSRFPLPEICQSRRMLNWDCPGCGLTRSFIHFFHGHWEASLQMHRLGWLLAIFTVLQIPYRLYALAAPDGLPLGKVFPQTLGYILLAALLTNWVLKLAGI